MAKRDVMVPVLVAAGLLPVALLAACNTNVIDQVQASSQARLSAKDLPPGTPFSFAVIGDSEAHRGGWPGYDVLTDELQDINASSASLAIFDGDLVDKGTEQEYQQGAQILQSSAIPVLPVVGNHEYKNIAPYSQYLQRPNDFSVDFGGWRFVSLDDGQAQVTSDQITWLDQQLATSSPVVIFAHEPPVYGTWQHGFSTGAGDFEQELSSHPNVKAAIFGHIHFYDHTVVNGIPWIVTGGGGAPLNAHTQFMASDGCRCFHYLMCQVQGDQFTWTMVPFTQIAPPTQLPSQEQTESMDGDW